MKIEFLQLLLVALAAEALLGYPAALFRAIGHPVTWIGALISCLDQRLNRDQDRFGRRKAAGILALLCLLGVAVGAAILLHLGIDSVFPPLLAVVIIALLTTPLLAQRSLDDHVSAVANALEHEGLAAGRKAVSLIVGRDTAQLDEAGVCRAAIESLAESASDGVIAPAFWIAAFGLPGGVFYKAVNTADSMIGHKSQRHLAFGWAAARLDDLINLPASRLTALLFSLAALMVPGASGVAAWHCAWRDAGKHQSPNAGWPEAAMAGALGLRLAGPRLYDGELVDSIYIGEGREAATSDDIRKALTIWRVAVALQFIALLAIFWLIAP